MNNDALYLQEVRAMIYIPELSIDLEIIATVYDDAGLHKVSKRLTLPEVRKAIEDAEKNYFDDDDLFMLTDKGREYAERIINGDENF